MITSVLSEFKSNKWSLTQVFIFNLLVSWILTSPLGLLELYTVNCHLIYGFKGLVMKLFLILLPCYWQCTYSCYCSASKRMLFIFFVFGQFEAEQRRQQFYFTHIKFSSTPFSLIRSFILWPLSSSIFFLSFLLFLFFSSLYISFVFFPFTTPSKMLQTSLW